MSINNEAENQFVKSLAEDSGHCTWIGLRLQTESQLQWNDGYFVNFTKWKGVQSNYNSNDSTCVSYDKVGVLWVNKSCSEECLFVCKRKGRSLDKIR